MGLFDSLKKMVGASDAPVDMNGVELEITKVESPFPFTDSVFKANFQMFTPSKMNLVSKRESLIAKRDVNGETEELVITSQASNDPYCMQSTYPRKLKGNETFHDGTCLIRVDFATALAPWGVTDSFSAISAGVRFYFRVEIDVKEADFEIDPVQEAEILVIG